LMISLKKSKLKAAWTKNGTCRTRTRKASGVDTRGFSFWLLLKSP
jgi:hypothetical protein